MVNPDPKFADKKRYTKVRFKGGGSFISEPHEVQDFLDDADDADSYTTEDVWMTEYEFRHLPEFAGF